MGTDSVNRSGLACGFAISIKLSTSRDVGAAMRNSSYNNEIGTVRQDFTSPAGYIFICGTGLLV